MRVFNRRNVTYNYNPEIVLNILKDEANPLYQINKIIPDDVKVLDIGAGNGILACVLKEKHKGIIIDGIEPDSYATNLIAGNYRKVFNGFAQDFLEEIISEKYDFIVLADVIEHITDPLSFLNNLLLKTSEKTKIIISVPNVAFGAVRISLLEGKFDYVDSGLLEKTHVRFFTLKTMENLIKELNINIEKLYYLQRDIFQSEIATEKSLYNYFYYRKFLHDDLAFTYQFLFVLTKKDVELEKKFFGEKTNIALLNLLFGNIKNYIRSFIKRYI